MMKDVWISIRSIQTPEQGEADEVVFDTDGYYFYDDGVGVFTYQESEITGLEGTRTSVMVMPDQVVVDRDGKLTSRMVFREGLYDSFPYDTPYGQANFGISTRKIRHSFNENGGHAEIDSDVGLEHSVFLHNRFSISVKEMEARNGQLN